MPSTLKQIAVCIPTVNDWASEVIRGVSNYVASKPNWSVFLSPMTDYDLEKALRGWRGHGVLTAAINGDIASYASGLPVPVVNVAGSLADPALPSVVGHDLLFGKVGAEHLLEQGHRHVACVTTPQLHFGVTRVKGFHDTMAARGAELCASLDADGWADDPWDQKISRILTWLRDLPRPLGVFCINDEHGHLVLEACRHGGIAVPEEVAVLGVNNSSTLCLLSNPSLSSVSTDSKRRGWLAAALLEQYMSHASGDLSDELDIAKETTPSGFPVWRVPPNGIWRRGSTAAFASTDYLLNGFERPYLRSNAWIADPSDPIPSLTLEWKKPHTFSALTLCFDTDFDHAMETAQWGHPERVMPCCVRDCVIEDDQGRIVAELRNNHQTRPRLAFSPPVTTRALTLRPSHPGPNSPAAIFAIHPHPATPSRETP